MVRKLDSLQAGRAIAVLSVLMLHLLGSSVEYLHGYFAYGWLEVLRSGVDIFFVISGVVMVITTYKNFGEPGSGKRFLIHRISRIYPPYLVLTVLLTIFWLIRPEAVNSKTGVDLLTSYTLWPAVKGFPLVQAGWTLSYEMMFYLVFFGMIVSIKRDRLPAALLVWTLAVIAGYSAIRLNASGAILGTFPRSVFVFNPFVFEFVAGCVIGLCSMKFALKGGRTSALLGILMLIGEGIAFQALHYKPTFMRPLFFGPAAALLIYGLVAWEREAGHLNVPNWVVRCGDISYSLYLVHLLVVHIAYRYALRFFNHPSLRPLFLIVAFALIIGASALFYKLVEIPLSRWTRTHLENLFKVPVKTDLTVPHSSCA